MGNLVSKKFTKQRLVILNKHEKLIDILKTNAAHPVIHKIEPKFKKFIQTMIPQLDVISKTYHSDNKYTNFPCEIDLRPISKTTSKSIRTLLRQTYDHPPEILTNPDPITLKKLGSLLNKLTNNRLKGILLRSLHGDIYCGTRLKKFGMSESEDCPRCSNPETIEHQLYGCTYTRKLWDLASKITSVPVVCLDQALGLDQTHDRATLTLHAEIISRLLSIERPVIDQLTLLKSIVTKLSIVEKGITKHQIEQMQQLLKNNA